MNEQGNTREGRQAAASGPGSLVGKPLVAEESWRRTDPSLYFLPEDDMLDFAGRPLLEAMSGSRTPWKIAFEDASPETFGPLHKALESVLPVECLEVILETLEAAPESTAVIFVDHGTVRAITPKRGRGGAGGVAMELAAVPSEGTSVDGGGAIGAALAQRLKAAVPYTLDVRVSAPGGEANVVVVVGKEAAFAQSFSHVRYLVAEGTTVRAFHVDAGSRYAHHRHDVKLAPRASFEEVWIHVGKEHQAEHPQLLERRVEVPAGASFRDAAVFSPAGTTRVVSNVVLQGERARAECSAAVVTQGSGVLDYEPLQEHVGPGGESRLKAKMVASGRSRAIFQGLVMVREGAVRTNAMQENRNLVLSKRARIDALPRLEILPNEVACKHGSATGELDDRQLYYLTTRGFPLEEAKALVVRGFALEGLSALPTEGALYAAAECLVSSLVSTVVKA